MVKVTCYGQVRREHRIIALRAKSMGGARVRAYYFLQFFQVRWVGLGYGPIRDWERNAPYVEKKGPTNVV